MLKVKLHTLNHCTEHNQLIHGTKESIVHLEQLDYLRSRLPLKRSRDSVHKDRQCRISIHTLNTNHFGMCVQESFFMDLLSASDFPGRDPDNELPFLNLRYSRRTPARCEA